MSAGRSACLVAGGAERRLWEGTRPGFRRPQDLMLTGQVQYDPCNDYYHLLNVASQASQADVLRAYRRAVKRHHPDAGGDPSGRAVQAVYEAYAVIGDPYRRGHYNCSRNRYGRAPSRPRSRRRARVAAAPIRVWLRRAAAITLSVVTGVLLLVAAVTGFRPARGQQPVVDHDPPSDRTARAGVDQPHAVSFEYATPFEPDDAD